MALFFSPSFFSFLQKKLHFAGNEIYSCLNDDGHCSASQGISDAPGGHCSASQGISASSVSLQSFHTFAKSWVQHWCPLRYSRGNLNNSGGARDFFLQVLWGYSAFYRGCYEIRVIAYVSHGSLLQHLPTYRHICLHVCSLKRLYGPWKAPYIDRIIIIIRLLPTDAHIAVFLCDGHWQNACSML